MPVRNVRVNNYLKETYESRMDKLSKIYIYSGWLIGVYRLPVILRIKGLSQMLTLIYSSLFSVGAISYVLYKDPSRLTNFVILLNLIQYFACIAITVMRLETVKKFYEELFDFDEEIGSKFLTSTHSKSNFAQAVVMYIFNVLFNLLPIYIGMPVLLELLPMDLNYILEVYYYGHLFDLLNSRLKSIRILLLSSFPIENQVTMYVENESIDYKDKNVIKLLKGNSKLDIKKLMFFYFKIIKAYDLFNSAVKWQFVVILATTFLTILEMCYEAALDVIQNKFTWRFMLHGVGMLLIKIVPIVVPCKFGEKIHAEVLLLRTALYTRVYNNVLDKGSRSVASSFLALTEARSLSFSVFRMIEINILLPFKLLGLLASYVVILLQFQKVLNFDSEDQ